MSPAEAALLQRICSPGKADGFCLLAHELSRDEWLTLQGLVVAGHVQFVEGGYITLSDAQAKLFLDKLLAERGLS